MSIEKTRYCAECEKRKYDEEENRREIRGERFPASRRVVQKERTLFIRSPTILEPIGMNTVDEVTWRKTRAEKNREKSFDLIEKYDKLPKERNDHSSYIQFDPPRHSTFIDYADSKLRKQVFPEEENGAIASRNLVEEPINEGPTYKRINQKNRTSSPHFGKAEVKDVKTVSWKQDNCSSYNKLSCLRCAGQKPDANQIEFGYKLGLEEGSTFRTRHEDIQACSSLTGIRIVCLGDDKVGDNLVEILNDLTIKLCPLDVECASGTCCIGTCCIGTCRDSPMSTG